MTQNKAKNPATNRQGLKVKTSVKAGHSGGGSSGSSGSGGLAGTRLG
jgi:hypothetical protein